MPAVVLDEEPTCVLSPIIFCGRGFVFSLHLYIIGIIVLLNIMNGLNSIWNKKCKVLLQMP